MTTRRTRTAQQETARRALLDATAAYNRAQEDVEKARLRQRGAIVAALARGIRQVELVELTGFTREHIRRITDEHRAAALRRTAADLDPEDADPVAATVG